MDRRRRRFQRRPRLHQLENRATLIRDPPAAVDPVDQVLREDIELGNAHRKPLRSLRPVRPASRQQGDVPFEVGHDSEPVGITH